MLPKNDFLLCRGREFYSLFTSGHGIGPGGHHKNSTKEYGRTTSTTHGRFDLAGIANCTLVSTLPMEPQTKTYSNRTNLYSVMILSYLSVPGKIFFPLLEVA